MEKIGFNKIPAITICYPQLVSLEKLAKNFPVLETDFEGNQNIINPMENEEDFINKTLEIYEIIRRMIKRSDKRKGNYETLESISISFFGKKKKFSNYESYKALKTILECVSGYHFNRLLVIEVEFF